MTKGALVINLVAVGVILSAIPTNFYNMFKMRSHHHFKAMFSYSSFVSHTMIYLIHGSVFTLAIYMSEEKIFQTYPRLV